jgi:hypothetical protein
MGLFFYRESPTTEAVLDFEAASGWPGTMTDFDMIGTLTTVSHSDSPLSTNPLSNGGIYAESMTPSGSKAAKIYFNPTSYGGAFYNIPDTKVISARACLRYWGFPYSNPIYITAKDTANFSNDFTNAIGYRLGIDQNKITLYGNANTILKIGTSNTTNNLWYSLKMEVTPLGASGDRIVCYRETSPGSEVWSSTIDGTVFDITVPTASVDFAPWGNNNRNGISVAINDATTVFVDNINFTTYNAP